MFILDKVVLKYTGPDEIRMQRQYNTQYPTAYIVIEKILL
jgi:hypothetical protein